MAEVLLVEPWMAGSHGAWARGWQTASRHRIEIVSHGSGPWRWRFQGSALTLANEVGRTCRRWRPDAVVVSSMVDVAQLLGLCRRTLGSVPVIGYRHESQLLHPQVPGETLPRGIALAEWMAANAVDRLIFNSEFHRSAYLAALPELLDTAPDHPHHGRLPLVAAASLVLPVGVDLSWIPDPIPTRSPGPPLVALVQRWHHDKRIEVVLDALAAVERPFRLVVAGDDDQPDPRAIRHRIRRLGERVIHAGFLPQDRYREMLLAADVVVSAAAHEFFGVAMVEAMAAGAVPLLPHRLSYPELVATRHHNTVLYDEGEFADRLDQLLADVEAARQRISGLAAETARYDWSQVAPAYDALVDQLVG